MTARWPVPQAVFVGVLLISLALMPPGNYSSDGESMLAVADSLGRHGSFAIPCDFPNALPGRGGSCYSNWYPLLSVLMAPFVLVGRAAADVAHVQADAGGEFVALIVPALATSVAAAAVAALAIEVCGDRRRAVLAACAFAFGTETVAYTRSLFAETLGAACVAVAVWGMVGRSWGRQAVGMAAVTLAILAKPQLVLVGIGIGVALALSDRSLWPLIRGGAATGLGGLIYLGYNALRFSAASDFGGSSRKIPSGSLTPGSILEAFGVLTISPRDGALLFSPVIAVGAWLLWRHRRHRVAAGCAGGAVGVFLFYLTLPYGYAWGSRYLVPALPLLCAALAFARGRTLRLVVGLAIVGGVIQLPTVLGYYQRYYREAPVASRSIWNPVHSQLWRVWPSTIRELRDAAKSDPAKIVSDTSPDNSPQLIRTVALWWWVLPVAGIPWELGLLVALLVMGGGVIVLRRAGRGTPGPRGPPAG